MGTQKDPQSGQEPLGLTMSDQPVATLELSGPAAASGGAPGLAQQLHLGSLAAGALLSPTPVAAYEAT